MSEKSSTFALAIRGNALIRGGNRAVRGTWFALGAIAQLVEQRTENPCVTGSIPVGTTHEKRRSYTTSSFFLCPCGILFLYHSLHQQLPKSVTFIHKTELNSVKDSIEAGVMFCSSLVFNHVSEFD